MTGIFALAIAAAQPAAEMESIDLPYQMIPAFHVYVDCVSNRFSEDPRAGGADMAAAAQANRDAVAGCRTVRAEQLRQSLELVTDYRPYQDSRRRAHNAVRNAFETFDRGFIVEPVIEPAAPPEAPVVKN